MTLKHFRSKTFYLTYKRHLQVFLQAMRDCTKSSNEGLFQVRKLVQYVSLVYHSSWLIMMVRKPSIICCVAGPGHSCERLE